MYRVESRRRVYVIIDDGEHVADTNDRTRLS
jgi:hypothetical protein